MKKIAFILAGCGAQDGSEIQEATLALYALSLANIEVQAFALAKTQCHTVNHQNATVQEGVERLQIEEAARIVRGNIKPIEELDVAQFDALFIPGGTGTAKNFFTFALDGVDFSVEPQYRKVVEAFHSAGKPIAAMCIAPLSLCAIISGVAITLGPAEQLAEAAMEKYGAKVTEVGREGVVVDTENKVLTTASYMYGDSTVANIGEGAKNLVAELLNMM
ncbi:MAG: isoprenoid biosynthesis glyoxalase ElbB [Rikenellaceae bacterium]